MFEPKTNIYIKNSIDTIRAVETGSTAIANQLKTTYGIKDRTPLLDLEYHIV